MDMVAPVLSKVVWWDAWADGSDIATLNDAHEKHKATLMETLGWLLVSDEKGVSIFNERCLDKGDESYRSRTFIPRAMIQSVTPVIKPRKPRSATRQAVPESPTVP